MAINAAAPFGFNMEMALCPSYVPMPDGTIRACVQSAICAGCGKEVQRPKDDGTPGIPVTCPLTASEMERKAWEKRQLSWPPGAQVVA